MVAQRRVAGAGGVPNPKTEIQKLLREGKQVWADSKEEAKTLGRSADVPDGIYEVDLQSAEFKVKDGTPYIVRRHVVVDGNHRNKVLIDALWYDLENARRTAYIFAWVEMLGFTPPDDPGELFDIVEAINKGGYTAKARVYHWGDNDRLGIDLLEIYEPEGAEDEQTADAEPEKAIEDMTVEELTAICTEKKIPIPTGRRGAAPGRAALVQAIKDWDATPAGEDDAAALLADTAAFCKAQDIKLTAEQAKDLEAMKKLISKYEYVVTELEESDASLLKDLGLEELIVEEQKPEPAPAQCHGQ